MEMLASFGHTLLSFVFVLSVIVFLHEFGHYLVARLCGVRIETFSIGFGRELFGRTDKTGTRWKFSLLPLGGYVKMFGDSGAASTPDNAALEQMTPQERAVSFHFKPLWKKSLIVAAGPVANFITAIAIFTFFAFSYGITSTEPVVGSLIEKSAAAEAGLKPGDRILAINGEAVETFHDIPLMIMPNLGTEVTLDVLRKDKKLSLPITPRIVKTVDSFGNVVEQPLIGIRSQKLTVQDIGFFKALQYSVKQVWDICDLTLKVLGQLITAQRGPEQLKGPIGIAQMSGQATEAGTSSVLWFIALLSVNLGLINLLPIPMLDGGHLLFYAVEALQGKPMAMKVQQFGYRIGTTLIVLLMGFTIFNDLINLS